jgi:hypothetical protein
MTTNSRILAHWLGIVILFALIALGLRLGLELRAKHRSDALLLDLRNLSIGKSSAADVLQVARRYDGPVAHGFMNCVDGDQCYEIDSGLPRKLDQFMLHRVPLQRLTGLTPWFVEAALATTGGTLTSMRVHVGANAYDNPLDGLTEEVIAEDRPAYMAVQENLRGAYRLQVEITQRASPEQRALAFDFDLSCAIAYGGCHQVCELMPSAWQNYEQKPFTAGVPITADEINDPRCKRLP